MEPTTVGRAVGCAPPTACWSLPRRMRYYRSTGSATWLREPDYFCLKEPGACGRLRRDVEAALVNEVERLDSVVRVDDT